MADSDLYTRVATLCMRAADDYLYPDIYIWRMSALESTVIGNQYPDISRYCTERDLRVLNKGENKATEARLRARTALDETVISATSTSWWSAPAEPVLIAPYARKAARRTADAYISTASQQTVEAFCKQKVVECLLSSPRDRAKLAETQQKCADVIGEAAAAAYVTRMSRYATATRSKDREGYYRWRCEQALAALWHANIASCMIAVVKERMTRERVNSSKSDSSDIDVQGQESAVDEQGQESAVDEQGQDSVSSVSD
jgi:hypothetical protein